MTDTKIVSEYFDKLYYPKYIVERIAIGKNALSSSNSGEGVSDGKEVESKGDYSSYIQSLLMDSFSKVVSSQTSAPQALARITIGTDGRISNYRIEKSSGDPVFDDSVNRAVTLAGRYFKPPPGGVPFERVFRFKPKVVGLP